MDIGQIWEEFFTTWKAVITKPEEFFAQWDPAEEWRKVIIFNVICGLIGGVITAVLTFFFGLGAIIRYPLFVLVGTFVGGVVLFVCFKIFGGKGDIEATIKMVGYTQAVRVFYVGIPFVGFIFSFLAGIYQIWLLIAGGKVVHQVDSTKAAMAVLLPVAIMGLFSLLAAVLAGVGWMAMMHAGGG
jgi:hypothetical protein